MKQEKSQISDEEMNQATGGVCRPRWPGRPGFPPPPEPRPLDPNDPNDSRNWKRNPDPNGPPYILPPGCDCYWAKDSSGRWILEA